MITFGLFASHDKEVPLEERNGKVEEQTAAPEEEGEGGEEDVEEAAEVTPTSVIITSVVPESSHHSCICWLSLSAVVS